MSVLRRKSLGPIAAALFVLAVVAACLAAWSTSSVWVALLVLLFAVPLIGGAVILIECVLRFRSWLHRQLFVPRDPSDHVS